MRNKQQTTRKRAPDGKQHSLRRHPKPRNRNGITLILAILCLAVSTMLIANLTRMIRLDGQNRVNHQHALQAEWLTHFGWKHAANRLAQDPTYSGDTWEFSLPTNTIARPATTDNVGRVTVTLQRDHQPITVTVVAQYPAGQPNQVTKTLTQSLSIATSTPE